MKNLNLHYGKVLLFISLLLITILVYAYPNGYTGATKKTSTTGCFCHTQNVNIIGLITGPDTVIAGTTNTYTIIVTRTGSTAKAGCNIAARLGTLTPGTGLKLQNGELTHSSEWNLVNGTVSRTFTYTAPVNPGVDTLWSTVAVGHPNGFNWSPSKRIVIGNLVGLKDPLTSSEFKLNQNYPNPFNPTTTISFELPKSSYIKLEVFDISGKIISNLYEGRLNNGYHEIEWNATDEPSGIYIYRLRTEISDFTRKMTLIK